MTELSLESLWPGMINVKWVGTKEPKIPKYTVKPDAPDAVKIAFEKEMKHREGHFWKKRHPEMKEPYMTWEGKIVERRDEAKRRKLPLAY